MQKIAYCKNCEKEVTSTRDKIDDFQLSDAALNPSQFLLPEPLTVALLGWVQLSLFVRENKQQAVTKEWSIT